jgi:hypothetical protein
MAAAEAGAGIFIKTIGFIIQGLEKVESALIKIGGQKFDFGVAGIRAQVDAIGNTLLADAGLRAKAGFEGVAGDAFQARIDEIKKRAEDAAGKAKPPTVPEPPKLNFDIGKFAGGMLNDFNSFLAANPLQPEFESPTVSSGPAALTRGSSAAQTLINSDSQSGVQDEIKNELKRAAKERKRQLEKNTKAIENVGNLLQTSVGVLVGL